MKITRTAAALVILVLPGISHAQKDPASATTRSYAQNGKSLPGPGEQLPFAGDDSEILRFNDQYPQKEKFCSDDWVSRKMCQPLVNNTPKVLERVCQSYRAGQLPNLTFHPSVGPFSIEGTDLQHFCDQFSPSPTPVPSN